MSSMGSQDILSEKKDTLLEGDVVTTSIYFGPKDGFLCKWAQTVPWGTFSSIVKDAIRAHLNHDENYRIPTFYPRETKYKKSITKSLPIKKEDYDVYNFIISIEKYNRAFEIKSILRYYLEKDSDKTVKPSKRRLPNRDNEANFSRSRPLENNNTVKLSKKRPFEALNMDKETANNDNIKHKKKDAAKNFLLNLSQEMNRGDYGS